MAHAPLVILGAGYTGRFIYRVARDAVVRYSQPAVNRTRT